MKRKKSRALVVLCFLLSIQFDSVIAQTLKVSNNGRYLTQADGKPFFYLGDTAWDLFRRLNREQVDRYLSDRAEKGFTVVQAVILFGSDGLDKPNAYGEVPFIDKNPIRPNERFFRHVDYVVDKAEQLGIYIGMLPTWGYYWGGYSGKVIFTVENARSYGEFLGKRYKNQPIIWILGGDENINNEREFAVIEAMALGLKKGDDNRHLITFHPRGPGLSSDYLHRAEWLDFNMYQSSHGGHDHDNGLYAEHDYQLRPAKPTLDGEPRYETIPVGFYFEGANKFDLFDAYDCRQAAYWSLLAGACGHTYGNNSVFQFWEPGMEGAFNVSIPWYEALDHPGAFQMGLIRRLLESRHWEKLVPNQSIIKNGPGAVGAKIRASVASDGSFAFIYSPRGKPVTIDKSFIKAKRAREAWYDPRYGITYVIHTAHTKGIQTYTPPTNGRGNDWLLIIEEVEEQSNAPAN